MSVRLAAETLRSEHSAHLAQFHIPPEMLEAAGVQSATDAEPPDMLRLNRYRGADLGGILFPYRTPIAPRVGVRGSWFRFIEEKRGWYTNVAKPRTTSPTPTPDFGPLSSLDRNV